MEWSVKIHILLSQVSFPDQCKPRKVSNGAKIRNRYNQVPHLTQSNA